MAVVDLDGGKNE